MKNCYTPPLVKKKVSYEPEAVLLAASVVTKNSSIETAGQKVEERDFSDAGFNHTWE